MKSLNKNRVLVVFSGGQDSTTCLGWAIRKFGKENVFTLSFIYGQKHSIEIDCAKEIFTKLELKSDHFRLLDLKVMKVLGDSALVTNGDVSQIKDGLPSSFVPGRNIIFLTHAAQLAYQWDCKNIVTGVCETDFSGYPDCRDNFIKSLQVTLSLGMEADFLIHTPLMWLDKKAIWELAEKSEVLEVVRDMTHTCYNGERNIKNEWGYGCGECPACLLRKKGYGEFNSNK